MAQIKKQLSKEFKEKINKNKRLNAILSQDFFTNNLIGNSFIVNAASDDRFVFVLTIVINPDVTVKSVNVNGVIAAEDDFEVDDTSITCEVKAFVSTFTFLLIIEAEGKVDAETTFNLTCDKVKVFSKDQKIVISLTKRGGFVDPKVPLP